MVTVTILIPLADNAAATFTPAHHTAFEMQLAALFGGPGPLPPGGDLRLLPRPGRDHRAPQGLTRRPPHPGRADPPIATFTT